MDRSRELEAALGTGEKRIMDNERETVVLQRRALRTTRAIREGEMFREGDLIPLRPCPTDAFPPYRAGEIVGRRSARAIPEGDYVRPSDLA